MYSASRRDITSLLLSAAAWRRRCAGTYGGENDARVVKAEAALREARALPDDDPKKEAALAAAVVARDLAVAAQKKRLLRNHLNMIRRSAVPASEVLSVIASAGWAQMAAASRIVGLPHSRWHELLMHCDKQSGLARSTTESILSSVSAHWRMVEPTFLAAVRDSLNLGRASVVQLRRLLGFDSPWSIAIAFKNRVGLSRLHAALDAIPAGDAGLRVAAPAAAATCEPSSPCVCGVVPVLTIGAATGTAAALLVGPSSTSATWPGLAPPLPLPLLPVRAASKRHRDGSATSTVAVASSTDSRAALALARRVVTSLTSSATSSAPLSFSRR